MFKCMNRLGLRNLLCQTALILSCLLYSYASASCVAYKTAVIGDNIKSLLAIQTGV